MDFRSSLLQILHFWFAYTQGRIYRKLCKYKTVRQKFTIQIERVFIRNLGNRKSDNTNLKHNNNNVRGHGDPFSGPKKHGGVRVLNVDARKPVYIRVYCIVVATHTC